MKPDQLETVPARQAWWKLWALVGVLVLLDIGVHALGAGPDRLLHDPAVYRLWDKNYLPGDWYTGVAVQSGVYFFYGLLVNFYHFLHLPEELWRQLVYIASLGLLYYALVRLARIFTGSALVVPLIALLHYFLATGVNQPVWLYGPFLQIDGGLAPRSVGVALSFLALFFLTRRSLLIPALLLGLATLIHVSNSLIVFTLFFLVWLGYELVQNRPLTKLKLKALARQAVIGGGVYLLAGGWFALYAASRGQAVVDFSTDKFIWTWIDLRAPYMALPLAGRYWWYRLGAHIVATIGGWLFFRSKTNPSQKTALDIIALVGLGSVVYFFAFYFFAFVHPWLPGFQFYSLRIIYFVYLSAYLFIALGFLHLLWPLLGKILPRFNAPTSQGTLGLIAGMIGLLILVSVASGQQLVRTINQNWQRSAWSVMDNSVVLRDRVPQNQRALLPRSPVYQYLFSHPEPVLAPPDLNTYGYYLPRVVSFKSFGFTNAGLAEWYERMNDVSQGELERLYQAHLNSGSLKPVELNWKELYPRLNPEVVLSLQAKYHFSLFLSSADQTYPFEQVAEDGDYRLYRVGENR